MEERTLSGFLSDAIPVFEGITGGKVRKEPLITCMG
jgi:hypothetical protein